MKKTIFGCTLLIMGTMVVAFSLPIAIPFWLIGLQFVWLGAKPDHETK